MNHTTNYQLSQWVKSDKVQMEDFNADNAKIDAALKAESDTRSAQVAALNTQVVKLGNCRIWTTTYIGDGTQSRTVTFPTKPLMVFVMGENIIMRYIYGAKYAMCSTGGEGGAACFATWEGNALTWRYPLETSNMCNRKDEMHYVVALINMGE